jgi:hypothetical protein
MALLVAASVATLASATIATGQTAATGVDLTTARDCYLVGQAVDLRGTGFSPFRTYVVTIDGVYLGGRTTDAQGAFSIPIHPGGLPSGIAQHVDRLNVTDGNSSAQTTFTLTRSAGARVLTSGGNPATLQGQFLVWGFSTSGIVRPVYVHYIAPSGRVRKTVSLGQTGGQCGYLKTGRRRVFPVSLSSGTWTLQIDTQSSYRRHPGGPVTRIRVAITG